jgi:hypothetical protein
MKSKEIVNRKMRSAVKQASRKSDALRLKGGVAPAVIQRENSIFPPSYFEQHRILNFSSAIGK